MIYQLENDKLQIAIQQTGAELCKIQSATTGREFMWDANPDVWASYAPVLFPIIGAVKHGYVKHNGQEYALPRHGFIRNNSNLTLLEQTSNSVTLGLKYDEELLKIYPFQFEFLITYTLKENKILVSHKVINHGNTQMFFSLGAHPAFKCPLNEGETYEDYYLEFEKVETDSTWLLESDGLVGNFTKPLLHNTNVLHLNGHLFDRDALIFKNLKSKQVSLRSTKSGQVITLHYEDFPYLGIWAKPNAHFVCIEPWLGIADSFDSDQILEKKEGILGLGAGKTFVASYTIEVFE
ncbi:aldose 1-epimerase family protein [Dyadobacter psychrotolerans]|uniref:Aldose 1-epimerase family protein n=1 Tax=Dyadobacter psychrotolerans TaxID=2541721 RepID=A0A4R5DTT9_9BACT|nr:aldose 1-epimerase family protein [Dyadobacter psychrotolerans]TDE15511.1 aldose 1-epimerase family protein [Dyadobacter psychrotolerans]